MWGLKLNDSTYAIFNVLIKIPDPHYYQKNFLIVSATTVTCQMEAQQDIFNSLLKTPKQIINKKKFYNL